MAAKQMNTMMFPFILHYENEIKSEIPQYYINIIIFLCVELYLPAGYLVFFFVYMHEAKELDKIKWKRFFSDFKAELAKRHPVHTPSSVNT